MTNDRKGKSRQMKFFSSLFLTCLVLLFSHVSNSKGAVLSFPEAEGFGAYAKGGRGGRVIEVTNLNASGPGSFAAACKAIGPRTIVFRVGGTILLNDRLTIREPYVTIAGQTAPGDGICIRNGTLAIATHDVVVRYLRIRVGNERGGPNYDDRDALSIGSRATNTTYNIIVDHCSFSWAVDENVSTWFCNNNITFQWCIISEGLRYQYSSKVPAHSMGMLLGSEISKTTVHHCLFAHNWDRNPYLGNDASARMSKPSLYDIRYNVVYNYGLYSCSEVRGKSHVNFVGNYYIVGPDGNKTILSGLTNTAAADQKIYMSGNTWMKNRAADGAGTLLTHSSIRQTATKLSASIQSSTPINCPKVKSVSDNYNAVLSHAGATLPKRDKVDERIVADVRNFTGKIIRSQTDVGGWPKYKSGTAPVDSDHDGIPDDFERQQINTDPNNAEDGVLDSDGNGYTNLEEYLNTSIYLWIDEEAE